MRVSGGGHGREVVKGAAEGRVVAGAGVMESAGVVVGTGVCVGGGVRRASGITVITSPFHTICTTNENPATIIPGRRPLAHSSPPGTPAATSRLAGLAAAPP